MGPVKRKPRALSSLEIFRLSGVCVEKHLGEAREAVLDGLAVDEAPEEGGERLLGGQGQVGAGVGDGGLDLAPVADDACIGEQFRDFASP